MSEMSRGKQYLITRSKVQESIAVFDKDFAVAFGIDAGIFLSRLMYYCRDDSQIGKIIDGERYYYSTYANWIEKTLPWMEERTLRRYVTELEKKNVIVSKQLSSTNRTKYYAPNYDVIWDILCEKFPGTYDKLSNACGQKVYDASGQIGHMLINREPTENVTSSNEDVSEGQIVKAPSKPRPRDLMFDMVAEVCVMEPKLVGPRIAKASHALKKAGYTSDQVLAFRDYWQRTSYQYKQSKKPPTPEQLIAQIKQSLVYSQGLDTDYTDDQKTLAEREAERRKNNRKTSSTVQGLEELEDYDIPF